MIIYKASELGACSKYLIAARCGFEPIENKYAAPILAFERGKRMELEIVEWLKREGWVITDTQKAYWHKVWEKDGEEVVIEAHPDALGFSHFLEKGSEVQHAIEIKTCDLSAYLDLAKNGLPYARGLFPRYRWQVSCYALVTRLPVVLVVREHETVEQKTAVYYLSREDLYSADEILARIKWLESKVDDYDIPTACDYPNIYCPLPYMHESEVEEDPDLEKLLAEHAELKRQRKRGVAEVDAKLLTLRTRILKQLGTWGTEKGRTVDLGRYKVSDTWGPVSHPYPDKEKLAAMGIDPASIMREAKMGHRLRVTDRLDQKPREKKEDEQ